MTRVMVFGTFDLIHPGHVEFFRQAKALAADSHLIVSVARDKNVARIKGTAPRNAESARLEEVRKLDYVGDAVLSDEVGFMAHIVTAKPDIMALGYDQEGEYVEHLKRALKDAGLNVAIVRLKPHEPERFKTSKLRM